MFDWSQFRDLIWEGRWDGLVMIFHAVTANVTTHWWFGPVLFIILITMTRKQWLRLLRYVGVTFARGYSRD